MNTFTIIATLVSSTLEIYIASGYTHQAAALSLPTLLFITMIYSKETVNFWLCRTFTGDRDCLQMSAILFIPINDYTAMEL